MSKNINKLNPDFESLISVKYNRRDIIITSNVWWGDSYFEIAKIRKTGEIKILPNLNSRALRVRETAIHHFEEILKNI